MINNYPDRTSANQEKFVVEQRNNSKSKQDQMISPSFMTTRMMQAQQGIGNKALQQFMSSMYKEDVPGDQQNEQETENKQEQQASSSSSTPADNGEQDDAMLANMFTGLSFFEILAMPPAPKKRSAESMLRDVMLCEITIKKAIEVCESIDEIESYFPQLTERFSLSNIEIKDGDTPEAYILIKINPHTTVKYGKHMTKDTHKRLTLLKRIKYKTPNGMKYMTDHRGRIHSVRGELILGAGTRNSYAQKVAGREDRLSDDEGGHLIASVFSGEGGLDNLVPMNGNLNKGKYKVLENKWRKHLNLGDDVKVKIKVVYVSGKLRPKRFKIRYSINNIETKVELKNKAGGV